MKYITIIAVVAILLVQLSGMVPESSVGGAMTVAPFYFGAALAVGIHEAWTRKRGVLGWIVNILVSLFGAFVGAECGNIVFEAVIPLFRVEGSLAATRHPLLYIVSAAMMLFVLLGAWLALQAVNRFR